MLKFELLQTDKHSVSDLICRKTYDFPVTQILIQKPLCAI